MALSCASIFACGFSPRCSGALATPVRFMWFQTVRRGSALARNQEENAVSAYRSWRQGRRAPNAPASTTPHHATKQRDKRLGARPAPVGAVPEPSRAFTAEAALIGCRLARAFDHRRLTLRAPGLAGHADGRQLRLPSRGIRSSRPSTPRSGAARARMMWNASKGEASRQNKLAPQIPTRRLHHPQTLQCKRTRTLPRLRLAGQHKSLEAAEPSPCYRRTCRPAPTAKV